MSILMFMFLESLSLTSCHKRMKKRVFLYSFFIVMKLFQHILYWTKYKFSLIVICQGNMIAFDFLSKHFELDSFYKLKIYRLYSYVCNLESQAQKWGKEKENKQRYICLKIWYVSRTIVEMLSLICLVNVDSTSFGICFQRPWPRRLPGNLQKRTRLILLP